MTVRFPRLANRCPQQNSNGKWVDLQQSPEYIGYGTTIEAGMILELSKNVQIAFFKSTSTSMRDVTKIEYQ